MNKIYERITHELDNPDAWVCFCRNEPSEDGFYPCDEKGNEVEPDHNWNGELYVCNRCGRIINQHTLEVVGKKS
jgi:hypothetical protein